MRYLNGWLVFLSHPTQPRAGLPVDRSRLRSGNDLLFQIATGQPSVDQALEESADLHDLPGFDRVDPKKV